MTGRRMLALVLLTGLVACQWACGAEPAEVDGRATKELLAVAKALFKQGVYSHSERLLLSVLEKDPENKRARKLLRKVRAASEAKRTAAAEETGQRGVEEEREQAEVEDARRRVRAALDKEAERMTSEVADARKAVAKIKGKLARRGVERAYPVPEHPPTKPAVALGGIDGRSEPVLEWKGRAGEGSPDASSASAARAAVDEASAKFALGYGYLVQGLFGEAAREYQAVVGLVPADRYAYVNLGYACRMRGDFEGAERAFRRCIELGPDKADGYNHLAYLYALNDTKLQEAEYLAVKAHALSPWDAEAMDTLGFVHLKKGNYESAYDLFCRAGRKCDLEEVELHKGLALERLGRARAARRVFERLSERGGECAAAAQQALAELSGQGTSGRPR